MTVKFFFIVVFFSNFSLFKNKLCINEIFCIDGACGLILLLKLYYFKLELKE